MTEQTVYNEGGKSGEIYSKFREMSNEKLVKDVVNISDGVGRGYCHPADLDAPVLKLLTRLSKGEEAIAAMKQIGELVHENSCHINISAAVTKIFMEYDK